MVTIGKGILGVVSGGDPVAVGLEGVRVDTVVVAASTTRKEVFPTEIKFTNSQ